MIAIPRQYRTALAVALLLAGCATLSPVERALERRVDPESLRVIDNVLRHGPPPPPSPVLVRELLARPFAAQDAENIFARSVPAALLALAEPLPAAQAGAAVEIRELLEPYLRDLAQAQQILKSTQGGASLDAEALVQELGNGLPSSARVREAAAFDAAQIARAATHFIEANTRLAHALRRAEGRIRFPETAQRYESAAGTVSLGTRGNDLHGADAAVIVDPSGNDTYERAPATAGSLSVIVDLGGDDRYRGADLAIHGLAAILEFSGDDAYESYGPAWGAAFAGASILVDFGGDDVYQSGQFGQGAAAAGIGALIDHEGNDGYRLTAGGQGLGLAGGLGLLWDRAGDDRYVAAGLRDAFDRGGGISFAQGAATGVRTALGGGAGILRDDAGHDDYAAEMFAQGVAYYYALGLLWDRGGNDRYRAARYAQGNGVHQAVGLLRDEEGGDRYELTVGVGQGMGLDLSVGVLADMAGDDRYVAPSLAQGSATANGVGLMLDAGGEDEWRLGERGEGWGQAKWSRGLPSVALILFDGTRGTLLRGGKEDGPAQPAIVHEPEGNASCPAAPPVAPATGLTLAEALHRLGPGLVGGKVDGAIWALALGELRARTETALAQLPVDQFEVAWALAGALHCALRDAPDAQAAAMWDAFERVLAARPDSPYAGQIASALRARQAPQPQMQRLVARLAVHPSCNVRTQALALENSVAAAQAALRTTCWQLQARALRILAEQGVAPANLDAVPVFLRQAFQASGKRAESSRAP
ncbi:MAG TPA: hypothetical protein VFP62_00595 [Burkholderiales bacterium]|nr:hypothetical protein [Burkholderiales bacterium]